ncbi:hypothetical protein ACIA6D_42680 [Streptomyces cacaoi]
MQRFVGADLVAQMVRGLFDLPVDHDRLTDRPGMFLASAAETLHVGDPAAPVPVE